LRRSWAISKDSRLVTTPVERGRQAHNSIHELQEGVAACRNQNHLNLLILMHCCKADLTFHCCS
jgi:hypothetical protein